MPVTLESESPTAAPRTSSLSATFIGVAAALIATGILARFVLLYLSIGWVDAQIWERLAGDVSKFGLYETYRQNPWMNHPPGAAWYGVAAMKVSQWIGVPFAQVFKLPIVLADCVTCALIWSVARHRAGMRAALVAAAVFAWSLPAILISAHHCNTDSAVAMFALLSLWLADIRRMPLLAGLALGVAINLKLTGALMIIPLLLASRSWREFAMIVLGLAVMAIPCVYVWIDLGYRFRQRVIQYHSAPTGWGLHNILDQLSNHPLLKTYLDTVCERYRRGGGAVVLLVALAANLRLLQHGVRCRFALAAIAVAVYAAVTPALAAQHMILPLVFILAFDVRGGAIWSALTGVFLVVFYLFDWDGSFPIRSEAGLYGPSPEAVFSTLAWAWVALYSIRLLRINSAVRL